MAEVSPSLSVITLNVNRLNSLVKTWLLIEWIKKYPTICCLQDTLDQKTQQLESEKMGKDILCKQ